MKLLMVLLLASIPPIHTTLPSKALTETATAQKNHGGRWYMAEDGHAVYCYGPQQMIPDNQGGLMTVATFCRGDRTIVKLHE